MVRILWDGKGFHGMVSSVCGVWFLVCVCVCVCMYIYIYMYTLYMYLGCAMQMAVSGIRPLAVRYSSTGIAKQSAAYSFRLQMCCPETLVLSLKLHGCKYRNGFACFSQP
jgi:hypothetical protein